jgi:hypothetical protein
MSLSPFAKAHSHLRTNHFEHGQEVSNSNRVTRNNVVDGVTAGLHLM